MIFFANAQSSNTFDYGTHKIVMSIIVQSKDKATSSSK